MLIRASFFLLGALAPLASCQQPLEGQPSTASQAARVYIYQTNIRTARGNPVWCDGIEVATLRHIWSYFVVQLPAGEHTFRGRHKENELFLDLVDGEEYYLELAQIMAYPGGEKMVRKRTLDGRAVLDSGKLSPVSTDDVLDGSKVIFPTRLPPGSKTAK